MQQRDEKLPIGSNKCKCAACGEYFGGVRGFDQHRVGDYPDRACLDVSGMEKAGLTLNDKGYWIRDYG